MARCGCGASCSCLIQAGDGVNVDGIGTMENPYLISVDSTELTARIEFDDTTTVDMVVTGAGTIASPMLVKAEATVKMTDLTDVQGTPSNGEVPVWTTDHWEFQPQTGGGGTGTPPSGVWGTPPLNVYGSDSLIGREVYIDSNGQFRSRPDLVELGAGVDLDTVTVGGRWTQSQSTEAAGGTNYPTSQAGLLEVVSNPTGTMTWQRYTVYASSGVGGDGGKVYTRGQYNGVWQPWVLLGGNDSGWITFTSVLTGGTARYRLLNGLVHIQVDGSATTVSGTPLVINTVALPVSIRPVQQVRSGAYCGGWPGTFTMDVSGNVSALHQSGANRSSVSGYLTYVI